MSPFSCSSKTTNCVPKPKRPHPCKMTFCFYKLVKEHVEAEITINFYIHVVDGTIALSASSTEQYI